MPNFTCTLDGCDKYTHGQSICSMHRERRRRTGSYECANPSNRPLVERAMRHIDFGTDPDSCWMWTGALSRSGYAVLRARESGGINPFVHRVLFEHHVAPVPDGMHLDHVCHVTACVNPAHLRIATPKQNAENFGGLQKNNTSGYRGVWRMPSGRFSANVTHNRVVYRAGAFDSAAEAGEAARLLRIELHTHNDLDRV